MVYFITRDVAVVTDLWCLAQVLGSVAPRMGVAEPLRRPTASRGRKRPRAAARLVGTSRAACCRPRLRVNPFLVWFVFLWLLFSGVWETLIFGTGDWFAFGEPFFCGLFTPTYPLPGHRLVPEPHNHIHRHRHRHRQRLPLPRFPLHRKLKANRYRERQVLRS